MTIKLTLTRAIIRQKRYGYNLEFGVEIPCGHYAEHAVVTYHDVSGEWIAEVSGGDFNTLATLAAFMRHLPLHAGIVLGELLPLMAKHKLPTEYIPAVVKYAELSVIGNSENDNRYLFEAFQRAFYDLASTREEVTS